MGDAGGSRFTGSLDPGAQEFIPLSIHHHFALPSRNIYYPYQPHHHFCTPPPPLFPTTPPYATAVSLPPTRSMPSRALLLSMVPPNVSESSLRRELEVFGDVRAVQMERLRDGIVTVHFYDLRQAQEALSEIQNQHMQQQLRLRSYYDAVLAAHASLNVSLLLHSPHHILPPAPPPTRGLVAGRAVWAQFTVPVISTMPDGMNQGTLVIFNVKPEVTHAMLKQIFQVFGLIKELRETPSKRHQRFVEFYDTRDAARALLEMNGKEIHGRHLVIEFTRPGGGHGKKCSSKSSRGDVCVAAVCSGSKLFNSTATNYPATSPSQVLQQFPPAPLHTAEGGSRDVYSKRNPNQNGEISRSTSSASSGSLPNSMGRLRIGGVGNGGEKSSSFGHFFSLKRKNGKKKSSIATNGSNSTRISKHQQQQSQRSKCGGGIRPWNGSSRQSKEYDPRFLINEDAVIESNPRDSRTTVMIKNIPNKYSQKLLLNMLDNHCIHCNEQIADGDDQPLSSYDFVYLPIDFVNKCNVGYGFVNMTSPEATLRLYKAFHRQSWEVFNSRKICEVTYARLQGVEALKEHFKNSKFPYDVDRYLPVVFSPPRDGRGQLTEPLPIIGRCCTATNPPQQAEYSCSSSSPGDSSKEGGDCSSDAGDSSSQLNNINGDYGRHDRCNDTSIGNYDDDDNGDVYCGRSGSSNGGVIGAYGDSE